VRFPSTAPPLDHLCIHLAGKGLGRSVHPIHEIHHDRRTTIGNGLGLTDQRSRLESPVVLSDLLEKPTVTLTPTINRLLRVTHAEKTPGLLDIVKQLFDQWLQHLPLSAARILELVEQPMLDPRINPVGQYLAVDASKRTKQIGKVGEPDPAPPQSPLFILPFKPVEKGSRRNRVAHCQMNHLPVKNPRQLDQCRTTLRRQSEALRSPLLEILFSVQKPFRTVRTGFEPFGRRSGRLGGEVPLFQRINQLRNSRLPNLRKRLGPQLRGKGANGGPPLLRRNRSRWDPLGHSSPDRGIRSRPMKRQSIPYPRLQDRLKSPPGLLAPLFFDEVEQCLARIFA